MARGDANSSQIVLGSVDLMTHDLMVEVKNGQTGQFSLEMSFDIDGSVAWRGNYHLAILNQFDEKLGFVNLRIDRTGSLVSRGKIRITNPDEILILRFEPVGRGRDYSAMALLVKAFDLTAKRSDLD